MSQDQRPGKIRVVADPQQPGQAGGADRRGEESRGPGARGGGAAAAPGSPAARANAALANVAVAANARAERLETAAAKGARGPVTLMGALFFLLGSALGGAALFFALNR